jgi:predicted CXXCH cytochrome family protein
MRVLIRFISRGSGGAIEQRDRLFDGEALTLGRATDQVLNLKDRRVELEHARIIRAGDRFLVSSRALTGVIVNGSVCRDATVGVGDTLQIGSNLLRFIAPGEGFDLAFTFELDPGVDARAIEPAALPLSLQEVGLRMRPWAWALFLVVLAGALLIPWLSSPQVGEILPTRQTVLPSDHAWGTGPLHSAHRSIGAKCEACHQRPFARVADDACVSCHGAGLHRHVTLQNLELPSLAATRCASCHHEHNEPSTLVRSDEKVCVECHADLQAVATRAVKLPAVSDFLREHPAFAASAVHDNSGLKFPHDVHLNPKGIKSLLDLEIMSCAGCHRADASGARFEPISMQRDCQRCHALSFDPREPERSVPHGRPERVVESLIEYYALQYLQGYPDALNTARPPRSAQRPGVDLSAAERARLLVRAREKAEITARDLFERRACQVCHEVQREAVAAGSGAAPRWQVTPVKLRTIWMPNARFSHAAHLTTLTPCATCHAAAKSRHASDVLMPKIETCRECHAGSGSASATQVASSCTSCHGFHIDANPLWMPVAGAQQIAKAQR